MKYKIGDKVRIKSLDWYNENKGNADKTNSVWCEDGDAWFYYHMSQYCGKIMTIQNAWAYSYTLEGSDSRWTDEMIEGLVEEEGKETSWKPSKEEMDVLYDLAYITNKYDEHKEEVITRLYQDLKREFFNGSSYENMFPNTENDVRRRSTIQVLEYARSLDNYNQYGKADIDKNIAWLEKQGKSALEARTDNELVEEEVGLVDNFSSRWVNEFNLPEGYIFKDQAGNEIHALKIVLEKANTLKTQSDNTLKTQNNMETETHRGYYTTEEETTHKSKKVAWFTFWGNDFADKVELDLSNRELIQEDGKWFVVKKKKEYPKTYEECCKILGLNDLINMHLSFIDIDTKIIASTNYHIKTLIRLNCLTKLLICRDAYWKLYGEEMGLGKGWKPQEGVTYCYMSGAPSYIRNIFPFPIEEMREVFYENFKDLIEQCKELL